MNQAATVKPKAPVDQTGWLVAHGLNKSFGKRTVVENVSLAVRRGEAVGLLGPNGAGKTTVFTMIMGLVKPDDGKILLDGRVITDLPLFQRGRLGIGYLPQEPSIFRGLSVEGNILAVLEGHIPKRKDRMARLKELLDEFAINHIAKSNAMSLSGGERRRGVDPIAVSEVKNLVKHLTRRGIGVLITDHSVRETLSLVDRAYLIYGGQVMIQGRPEVIAADPEARRVYLGDAFEV